MNFFNRYFVTEGDQREVVKTSSKESEARDFMYGNADRQGSQTFKLWDMRLAADGDSNEPTLIGEVSQRS